ncbi:MAG: DUF4430 domain-containing protein [Bacteroidota bacterium]
MLPNALRLPPIFLALMIAFAAGWGCAPQSSTEQSAGTEAPADTDKAPTESKQVATVTFHWPDSTPSDLEVTWTGETTVGDALADQKAYQIEMKDYKGMGRLLTGIESFQNGGDAELYWQFCLNGVYSMVGIDEAKLATGDQVDWHFTAYGENIPCKKAGE